MRRSSARCFASTAASCVLGVLLTAATAVASQVGNYMVTYAVQVLKLPPALAQGSVLMGGVMTFAFALVGGLLCDRYGRRIVNMLPGSC